MDRKPSIQRHDDGPLKGNTRFGRDGECDFVGLYRVLKVVCVPVSLLPANPLHLHLHLRLPLRLPLICIYTHIFEYSLKVRLFLTQLTSSR